MTKSTKKIVVLYHKSCSSGDGFGAAWAARKKFGSRAEYIGVNHSDLLYKTLTSKEVYMLDITFPKDEMSKILKTAKRVIVLDHHKSVVDQIKMADEFVYDIKRSGATIAWSYFFPKKKIPPLLKYLEDGDIWRLALPHTREIFASLHSYERDFKIWDKIIKEIDTKKGFSKHLGQGSSIVRYQDELIKKAIKNSYEVIFCGHKIWVVNSSAMHDYIGHELAKKSKANFSIVWRRAPDGIHYSLRAMGRRDVSIIAAKLGGGGHKHSAAFALPANKSFPWKEATTKK